MTAEKLDVHRLSEESLRAIAVGAASEADLRLLRSVQRSQLLLILRALSDLVEGLPTRYTRAGSLPGADAAWQLLTTVQAGAPEALDAVLADPSVMAWAVRLLRRLGGTSSATSSAAPLWADIGQFHAVSAAAALCAGIPAQVRVPAYRGMLWLPGAGVAGPVSRLRWSAVEVSVGPDGAVVRGDSAEVSVRPPMSGPVAGWRPQYDLWNRPAQAYSLRLDAVSPFRDFTVSPRAALALNERRLHQWKQRVAAACDLLERESPEALALLTACVRVLVPRSFPSSRGGLVASSSSPDAFGAVALSLPHDEVQTAAVLVHEARHQQLNALLALVQLVRSPEDGDPASKEQLYYAPWRSDPRPAHGLLHGIFAFAGMAHFWKARRTFATGVEAQRADFEFAVHREQVGEAVTALLAADELTRAGRLFASEIAEQVRRWQREEVLPEPARLAAHYCALRRAVWRVRHMEIGESPAARAARAWMAGADAPVIPPSRLSPRPDTIREDSFGVLARLYLSAADEFALERRQTAKGGDPGRAAAMAAVAGDHEEAAHWYRERVAEEPCDAEAWIGAALALPGPRGEAGALLPDRPEVVAGVHRAVVLAGGDPPDPDSLAAWLHARG